MAMWLGKLPSCNEFRQKYKVKDVYYVDKVSVQSRTYGRILFYFRARKQSALFAIKITFHLGGTNIGIYTRDSEKEDEWLTRRLRNFILREPPVSSLAGVLRHAALGPSCVRALAR